MAVNHEARALLRDARCAVKEYGVGDNASRVSPHPPPPLLPLPFFFLGPVTTPTNMRGRAAKALAVYVFDPFLSLLPSPRPTAGWTQTTLLRRPRLLGDRFPEA